MPHCYIHGIGYTAYLVLWEDHHTVCLPWYAQALHSATAGKYSNYSSFFNTVVSSHNEVTMCGHILKNESIPGRWIGRGVPPPNPRPPPVTQPCISSCGGMWRVIFIEHPWLTLQPSCKNIGAIWSAEKGVDSYEGRTGLSGLNVIRGTNGSQTYLD
jgi:hypothetical protein